MNAADSRRDCSPPLSVLYFSFLHQDSYPRCNNDIADSVRASRVIARLLAARDARVFRATAKRVVARRINERITARMAEEEINSPFRSAAKRPAREPRESRCMLADYSSSRRQICPL